MQVSLGWVVGGTVLAIVLFFLFQAATRYCWARQERRKTKKEERRWPGYFHRKSNQRPGDEEAQVEPAQAVPLQNMPSLETETTRPANRPHDRHAKALQKMEAWWARDE